MNQKNVPLKHYFMDPLWNNNQILIAILGISLRFGSNDNSSDGPDDGDCGEFCYRLLLPLCFDLSQGDA